jgi:pyrroloquinoline quinone biosynthesis protein B
VTWRALDDGREIDLTVDGRPSGLSLLALPAPGKQPIHLTGIEQPTPLANIGLRIREAASGRVLAYVSGAGGIDDAVRRLVDGADCVFFDGTFWTETELIDLGLGTKRARDMTHLPIGGGSGSLAALADLRARRKVFIHVNNTNPILREDSAEAAAVRAAGWEVATDGLEIAL